MGSPSAKGFDSGPFSHTTFTVLWTATVVANIGTWMYGAASGWLMTSLSPQPLIVSLVQAATSLPLFLLALPAGALADIVDARRFLIAIEAATTAVATVFAAHVWLHLVTPSSLLLFTFLLGIGEALSFPVWLAIVPLLVPKHDLKAAVTTNSVGINISRAVGPAVSGVLIGALGIAAPFWFNAISNLAVIGALLWWRSPQEVGHDLPAERFGSAMRTGLRYARHNPHLRATLMRSVGFFPFAAAYWALLPLVARQQIAGGPELYGILLGAIGVGAVVGGFALHSLRLKFGADRLETAGVSGTIAALVLFGLAQSIATAMLACLLAGISWIAVVSTLSVSIQASVPNWVRGRGVAIFVTVLFGLMSLGSVVWGQVAAMAGLPPSHFIAAAGALLAIPLTQWWKIPADADYDLAPSNHWPTPITTHELDGERGPVLVTVEYLIGEKDRRAFLIALERLGQERRRDGAYAWGAYEDTAQDGRFLETFLVESWLEHLRQHERVTKADEVLQEKVRGFQRSGTPKVTHFVAVRVGKSIPVRVHKRG